MVQTSSNIKVPFKKENRKNLSYTSTIILIPLLTIKNHTHSPFQVFRKSNIIDKFLKIIYHTKKHD